MNQFINVAVAEKLAHLQHDKWLARRREVTPVRIAQAMAILNRPTGLEPDTEDRLPEGYTPLPQ